MKIPGLAEAFEKLDDTSEQMTKIVSGLDKIAGLLEEQNQLLRKES